MRQAVVVFVMGVALGFVVGCDGQSARSKPMPASIEEARARDDIEIGRGYSHNKVKSVHGDPWATARLSAFEPQVVTRMIYQQGLEFLCTHGVVCGITVTAPFSGEVFGMRIGDPIDQVIAVFGPDFQSGERHLSDRSYRHRSVKLGFVQAYSWEQHFPGWWFCAKDGEIVAFNWEDPEILSIWTTVIISGPLKGTKLGPPTRGRLK